MIYIEERSKFDYTVVKVLIDSVFMLAQFNLYLVSIPFLISCIGA